MIINRKIERKVMPVRCANDTFSLNMFRLLKKVENLKVFLTGSVLAKLNDFL